MSGRIGVACVIGVLVAASAIGCGPAAGCPEGFIFDGTTCTFADAGVMLDAAGTDAYVETDAFVVPIDGPLPDAYEVPDAWAPDAWMPFDACVPAVLHADVDGDGFGDPATARDSCLGRPGLVEDATDCDDARAETHPGATEVCNGIDDDCDGSRDEGLLLTFYVDADGDTHGLASVSMQACSAPSGYVTSSDDCNDGCASCFPGSAEVCDGLDNDCDGTIDDGVLSTFYVDADGDTYGTTVTTQACTMPSGYAARSGDCNDGCATCNPGRSEICDGLDNDCDGTIDDGVLSTFYVDADGDTYGTTVTTQACTMPSGYAARSGDCNDGCATCYPGRSEVCDGLDNDCDTLVDDGVLLTFYVDADGDTYGTTVTTQACTMPSGYAARSGDCNDGCATCNPGRSEVCDGLDNDCDTLVDDGVLLTFYRDADSDMHGLATMSVAACTAPSGYVALGDDCNDACATCYPGRAEVCDGLDNNCNTTVDDGVLTTFYLDCDGDNFTLASPTTRMACSTPARPASCTGLIVWRLSRSGLNDCADEDSDAYPGQTAYSGTPISGPRAGTTMPHDFNCDGSQTQERTSLAACLDATTPGWATSVPACGAFAPWDDCLPPNASEQQRCR
jgi:hypothetical protein